MTGFLDTVNGAYLADWSVAALSDIGYHINQNVLSGDNGNELSDGVDLLETYQVVADAYVLYPIEDTATV